MKSSNRDLLVLVKDENVDDSAIQSELESLNQLLYWYETENNSLKCYEVIDVDKHKILQTKQHIQKALAKLSKQPFLFLLNKN
ncbi:hypothetical protein [Gynurincola endophyticus]|jgi:hypothetical protein|uniref:hypothetical protein n=1 Tax=Gynurincola endophyticus TaxID=2479004 RepID=UPI000F8E828D|nr:hypothetical protein [Gynurincola endophyticus]